MQDYISKYKFKNDIEKSLWILDDPYFTKIKEYIVVDVLNYWLKTERTEINYSSLVYYPKAFKILLENIDLNDKYIYIQY